MTRARPPERLTHHVSILVAELWQRRRCAVLLVTHDVDEALLLADRVLVMREDIIARGIPVMLERPRRLDLLGVSEDVAGRKAA